MLSTSILFTILCHDRCITQMLTIPVNLMKRARNHHMQELNSLRKTRMPTNLLSLNLVVYTVCKQVKRMQIKE